jgi:NAD(P)-dependent dehydrogenase (short-subunit alcohol dehydrogenase family)
VKDTLEGKGLDALVNVAGIGQSAPMEYISAEKMQEIFNVNVFGLVFTTQAFLPLLRMVKGRIVNISSIGALITIPFGGTLCATKRAVEAITDAMRMELVPAGIHVVAIRPASIHTPAVEKLAETEDAIVNSLPPEGRERYGESIRHFIREACAGEMKGSPPEVVAETVFTALTDPKPRAHYLTGKTGHLLSFLGKWVPDSLRDQILLSQLGLPRDFGKEA